MPGTLFLLGSGPGDKYEHHLCHYLFGGCDFGFEDTVWFWAGCLSIISKDNEAMQSWLTLSHYGIICGGFTRVGDCT